MTMEFDQEALRAKLEDGIKRIAATDPNTFSPGDQYLAVLLGAHPPEILGEDVSIGPDGVLTQRISDKAMAAAQAMIERA
jgi:hypothetical protein